MQEKVLIMLIAISEIKGECKDVGGAEIINETDRINSEADLPVLS
jgi:hypothetical protein